MKIYKRGVNHKKKFFRDIYSDRKSETLSEGDFIGLIPYLWLGIKKLCSLTVQTGKFWVGLFSYVLVPLIIIVTLMLLYTASEILPKKWQDYKHKAAVAELQTKDYLVSDGLRRVCYQQMPFQKEKSICLTTQGAVLSPYRWYASFERYDDDQLSITVTLTVGLDEKKYPVEFYKMVNGQGVWSTKWKLPKPFSCHRGTWRFAPGSVHEKAKSRFDLNPKIRISSKGCPDYVITFP